VGTVERHTATWPPDSEAIGAHAIGPSGHKVKASPPDRVCEQEGCVTRLSVYNHGSRCAVHTHLGPAVCTPVESSSARCRTDRVRRRPAA